MIKVISQPSTKQYWTSDAAQSNVPPPLDV